jgi:hypothetical protein
MPLYGNGSGKGDGWGGPARGAGKVCPKANRFEKGNRAAVGADHTMYLSDLEKAQMMRERLFKLGLEAQREETQVAAARAYLDRIEGLPVARNMNFATDDVSALDDVALAARKKKLERAVGAGDAGTASPPTAPEPDGIRH